MPAPRRDGCVRSDRPAAEQSCVGAGERPELLAPTLHYGVNLPGEETYPGGAALKPKTLHRALNELLAAWGLPVAAQAPHPAPAVGAATITPMRAFSPITASA